MLWICDVLTGWEEKEVAQESVPLDQVGSDESSDRKLCLKVVYTMRWLSVSPKIKSKCGAAPDGLIQLLNLLDTYVFVFLCFIILELLT